MQRFTRGIAAGVLALLFGTTASATPSYTFQFDYGGGAGVTFNSGTNTYTVDKNVVGSVDVKVYLYENMSGGGTSVLNPSSGQGLFSGGVRLGRISALGSGAANIKITGMGSIAGGPFTDTSSPNKYWEGSSTSTDKLSYYNSPYSLYPSDTPLAGVLSYQDIFGSAGALGTAAGSDYRILLGTFTFDVSSALPLDQITIRASDLFSNADDTMTWDTGTVLDFSGSDQAVVVVVPEPPSIIALATLCASGGLLWIVRRRRTKVVPKAEPAAV